MNEDVYIQIGFKSRKDYLKKLAKEYNVQLVKVSCLASLLGPEEDFDLLVSMIKDSKKELV